MKVLIIDDQELVLLTLEKYLVDLGYLVKTANNMAEGITLYDEYKPNLVVTDIDMPVNPDSNFEFTSLDYIKKKSGLEIIKHIRLIKKATTPVMVLSGTKRLEIVEKAFSLGANDYMIKPVHLDEIGIRVKKLCGAEILTAKKKPLLYGSIQKTYVGVVIPCCYASNYKPNEEFISFVNKNLNYHLCFVNYSKADVTTKILNGLRKIDKKRISVLNIDQVVCKSEAVRLGMLHLEQLHQFEFIGFINEELRLNMDNVTALVDMISQSDYKSIVGVAQESKTNSNLNFFMKGFVNRILGHFIETYKNNNLGVEVFNAEIVKDIFKNTFSSETKFEAEISARIQLFFGKEKANDLVCTKIIQQSVNKRM